MVFAVLAAFAVAAPVGANAQQWAPYEPHILPPYAITPLVRAMGLDPVEQPMRRGPTTYVVHAIDRSDREVRVLVDGRTGAIISVTPTITASRLPPQSGGVAIGPGTAIGPGVTVGPYERIPSPGSATPPPGTYPSGRSVIYDDEPRELGARPPADIPNAPPRVITATPNPMPRGAGIDTIEPQEANPPVRSGMLPPPPDRFPQRLAPPAPDKPKPAAKRAAEVPRQAPLPKPRPTTIGEAAPSSSNIDAVPPAAPEKSPAPERSDAGAAVPN
jgi:hypothetical protein